MSLKKKVYIDIFSILECHLFLPNLVTRFCTGTDYHLKQEQEISWLHLIGFVLINTRKLRLPNKDLIVKKEQENIIFAPCQHVSTSQIYNAQVPTTLSIERIQSTNKSLLNASITSQWHNNQLHKVNLNHGGPKSLFFLFLWCILHFPGAGVMNLVNQDETSLLMKQCSPLINHQ